jgi:hypothetical protein
MTDPPRETCLLAVRALILLQLAASLAGNDAWAQATPTPRPRATTKQAPVTVMPVPRPVTPQTPPATPQRLPAPAPAPANEPDPDNEAPVNPGTPTERRLRVRTCGSEWIEMKRSGAAAGQIWREFARQCYAR